MDHRQHTEGHTKEIIWLIRRLMQAEERYSKALERGYHVSSCQIACLLSLYEKGPLPPSQIARDVMVHSSTVTGVIDRLERKGLVLRSRTSADRRVITILLTEAGRRLAEQAPPPVQKKIVEGLRKLPSEEVDEILHGMGKLTHLLETTEPDEDETRLPPLADSYS